MTNSIFVLDGDQEKSLRRSKCPRIILLPGEERPENIFYKYLKGLYSDDEFWGKTGGYTKQVCFRDLSRISNDRTIMKRWFKNQSICWGGSCSKLFNRWKKDKNQTAEKFKEGFIKIIQALQN